MNNFLKSSKYGIEAGRSGIKKTYEENVYNQYGKTSTTKNFSLPFRSISRDKKG